MNTTAQRTTWDKLTSRSLSFILCSLLAFGAASCGAKQGAPVSVARSDDAASTLYYPFVIPEIARLFADPPIVGRTPSNVIWSPDVKNIAYIHHSYSNDKAPVAELWVHEMAGHRERPLFTDQDKPVSSYDWCGDDNLIVSAAGDVYFVDITGDQRQLVKTEAAESGAACSPDGTKVAYVREHNIFIFNIESKKEQQITSDGTADRSYGEVTWVYGEEFGTAEGFAWSPDSRYLWLYAMDVSEVATKTIVTDADGNTRVQSYPRPGERNPVVHIGAVDLQVAPTKITWLETGDETEVYLPQVTWHPDSDHVVVARLDRLQTLLELLMCDAATGDCSQILAERDPRWINLLGPPKFIREGKEFLWLSERDGFAHIYRYDIHGTLKGQLTRGKWTVRSIDAVDEETAEVYFTANADELTEYGIYRVEAGDDDVERVSEDMGVHHAQFSPRIDYFLDTHSALDRPPRTDIRARSGELVAVMDRADLSAYSAPDVMNDLFPIETADGETLMALLTRPTALEPDRRYPVLIYVYGGPHAQVVRNAFRTTFQPWRNYMASRGVLVFSVDGRGSGGRGRVFETAIHRRLGEVELQDQLAGAAYLKTLPFVDPKRIGIFGWSYGGTMVLNALLRTKGVFKVGVAVAPVTDWRQYDTAYTERYMQRPSDNPEGYEDTSLLAVADRLKTPLLLVHGLADDNVQFSNSALLVNAFLKAGRSFEVMFYPGKSHGIRGAEARTDLFTRITRFVERHI